MKTLPAHMVNPLQVSGLPPTCKTFEKAHVGGVGGSPAYMTRRHALARHVGGVRGLSYKTARAHTAHAHGLDFPTGQRALAFVAGLILRRPAWLTRRHTLRHMVLVLWHAWRAQA